MTTPHRYLTPAILTDVLQSAGYRVAETKGPDGMTILASATGGLGFEVRFFNPLTPARKGAPAGADDRTASGDELPPDVIRFADASLRTAFRVEGDLPLALVNAWNVTHRFARLNLAGAPGAPNAWLFLEMDVIALGGVLADNLRAQVEIWDRLVQELIAWLRQELPKLAKAAPVAEPAGPAASAEPAA